MFGAFNPPEYFFKAKIVGDTSEVRSDDPLLEVETSQALLISNLQVPLGDLTDSAAKITWNTNKKSSSSVSYGLTTGVFRNVIPPVDLANGVILHSIAVSNLNPCTVYRFQAASRVIQGAEIEVKDGKFTTKGCNASVLETKETDSAVNVQTGVSLDLTDLLLRGLTLSVPSQFDAVPAHFQILRLNKDEFVTNIGSPQDFTAVGPYTYHLNALSENEISTVSQFGRDLTVKIKYDPSEIAGIDEDSLSIQRWDGSKWNLLTDCKVDKEDKSVTCQTASFSDFVLVGKSLPPSPDYNTPYSSPSDYGTPTYGTPSYDTPAYGTPSTSGNSSDLNKDGKVNIFDLSILLRNWNKSGQGDLNSDGKVNIFDLSTLLRNWSR